MQQNSEKAIPTEQQSLQAFRLLSDDLPPDITDMCARIIFAFATGETVCSWCLIKINHIINEGHAKLN